MQCNVFAAEYHIAFNLHSKAESNFSVSCFKNIKIRQSRDIESTFIFTILKCYRSIAQVMSKEKE